MSVDVIIPVYNGAAYLERAVSSALLQEECRVILVDDGSTDGTARLCDELAANGRVRVIHQENGGVSRARNTGLRAVEADYVAFLDADDLLPAGCVGTLLSLLEGADAICGAVMRCGRFPDTVAPVARLNGEETLRRCLLHATKHLHTHGWLFKRELCSPDFDETLTLGEDGEWMIRVLKRVKSAVFAEVAAYDYGLREDSAIHGGRPDVIPKYLRALEAADKSLLPLHMPRERARYRLDHLLLMLTHGVVKPASLRECPEQCRQMRALVRSHFQQDLKQARLRPTDLVSLTLLCLRLPLTPLALVAVRARQWYNARLLKEAEQFYSRREGE